MKPFVIKTHHNRKCKECTSMGINGGCVLPFRKTIRKRYIENLDKKPLFFKFRFLRSRL